MEQQMSENRYVLDMSCGNITQILLQFSVPLLVGNLFQQVYNVVDSIVVGRYLGSKALGAVGSVGMISFLFFSLCIWSMLFTSQNAVCVMEPSALVTFFISTGI